MKSSSDMSLRALKLPRKKVFHIAAGLLAKSLVREETIDGTHEIFRGIIVKDMRPLVPISELQP